MKLISHRGNINGRQERLENSPGYIDAAIAKGFDVEVDMWFDNKTVKLGHDRGQYIISLAYLLERKDKLWIHCKNDNALNYCLSNDLHCFFHDTDAYTFTSKGFVWAYPGSLVIANDIFISVKPEETEGEVRNDIYGVCSDYVLGYLNV